MTGELPDDEARAMTVAAAYAAAEELERMGLASRDLARTVPAVVRPPRDKKFQREYNDEADRWFRLAAAVKACAGEAAYDFAAGEPGAARAQMEIDRIAEIIARKAGDFREGYKPPLYCENAAREIARTLSDQPVQKGVGVREALTDHIVRSFEIYARRIGRDHGLSAERVQTDVGLFRDCVNEALSISLEGERPQP
jgi:hypothetical protein